MTENYIQMVVTKCADAIGIEAPRFYRWTRIRGRAHLSKGGRFSLPLWLKDRAPEFQIAYIAHEVSHFANGFSYHGKEQREAETTMLAAWFIVPVYDHRTYPVRFLDLFTNEILCDGVGRKPYDYRYESGT